MDNHTQLNTPRGEPTDFTQAERQFMSTQFDILECQYILTIGI
jgi:hypothetical protein